MSAPLRSTLSEQLLSALQDDQPHLDVDVAVDGEPSSSRQQTPTSPSSPYLDISSDSSRRRISLERALSSSLKPSSWMASTSLPPLLSVRQPLQVRLDDEPEPRHDELDDDDDDDDDDINNLNIYESPDVTQNTFLLPSTSSPPISPSARLTLPPFEEEQENITTTTAATAATTSRQATKRHTSSPKTSILNSAILGFVNFIVCTPTLVSYAAIVFRAHVFRTAITKLTKLFFLASALHQLTMTLGSKLPFAVGQVQDVGLILLSQLATNVADNVKDNPAVATATTLVTCALATFIVGVGLFFVGRFHLGGLVQLIPLPVVGGYLSYIGYFCLAAGISLSTGISITTPATWIQLARQPLVVWLQIAAACVQALLICATARFVRNPYGLPLVLLALPAIFFAIVYTLGYTVQDAREHGWLLDSGGSETPPWGWQCYDLFMEPQKLSWSSILNFSQIANTIALFLVVSFGSCLDIAAVQAGQGSTQDPSQAYEVDFDHELQLIGVSNAVAGMCGAGFTGSYIFSQTIFSQRQMAGKLNGLLIFILELLLFIIPFDILDLMPGSYVGGIMAFFGIEIMGDWLVAIRAKVTVVEYCLVIATFIATLCYGVLGGMVIGSVLGALVFVYSSALVRVADIHAPERLAAPRIRSRDGASVSVRVVNLRGQLFFGQSIAISDTLHREIISSCIDEKDDGDSEEEESAARDSSKFAFYVIIDFEHVDSIDSTAARALSSTIKALAESGGGASGGVTARVYVVISGVTPHSRIARLLSAHGILPSTTEEEPAAGAAGGLKWYDRQGLPPCVSSRELGLRLVENDIVACTNKM
ncbi:STAS domain-containing protein [Pseudoscourfieldia marina]